jgi:hypothetical protein
LNHARSALSLAPYAIPSNFTSMSVPQQLLTLSNLDRAVYSLQAISGINATLNSAAQQGVTNGGDPVGVNVGSNSWTGWASNWAAGYTSALWAYYDWMYDDGPGSTNIGCTSSNSSDCWGHRLNTLHNFGSGVQIAMGVGTGPDRGAAGGAPAYTELYESFATSASIPY